MKAALILSAAVVCTAVAETAIPVAFDRARYEETLSQSPFALAQVLPPPPGPSTPSKLDTLVVTGLGKLDDGRTYVVLQQPGDPLSIRLEGSESVDGLSVKQVKWADDWHHSTVVVTDGTKEKSIEFNKNPVPTNAGRSDKSIKTGKDSIIRRR